MVYGIGVLVCAIALAPLCIQLVKRRKTMWGAALEYFVITVLVCMAMELAMGFLLNQPDAAGNYPLWDNSQLPGNIFGPGVDRERHRPGRRGHAVHVNHLPAVPKGAGKSAHPRHAPGCGNRCCGLCGAVRGEILVSTATPPHVWQHFPKVATEESNRTWHHSHCPAATPSCGRSTTLSQRAHCDIYRFPWSKSLFARKTYNFARLIVHHARRVSIIRNTRRAESPIFLLTHFLCFGITNNRLHVIQKQESNSHRLRR